jgi:F0F1-type ATP synthase assembly protein I
MALALEWVAKITTVGVAMVLPGIAGHFLDERLGTSYFALIGFALGLVVGLWHMIRWTKPPRRPPSDTNN